jgi:predicted nuclease of predicted toxin-antitoxin system
VKALDFPLLADENIHPGVVAALRARGKDVRTVFDESLAGASDTDILRRAFDAGRVVVTQDSDFGMLALYAGHASRGIVYLRPGHIQPEYVLKSIEAIENSDADVEPGFILVAERRGDSVRIRLRATGA